jgi:hypothetical protein
MHFKLNGWYRLGVISFGALDYWRWVLDGPSASHIGVT